jgi:multidrug resistance efflux pump
MSTIVKETGERSATKNAPSLRQRVESLRLPDHRSASAPTGGRVAWLACLVFAGTSAFLAYREFSRPQQTVETKADQTAIVPTQPTESAASASMAASGDVVLEAKGYIVPAHQILVSPKVSGMVTELLIEEGKRVKKGDVLARLESVDYGSDVGAAESLLAAAEQRLAELERGNRPEEIAAAKAELQEAEAQRNQLELEWQRTSKLRQLRSLAPAEYEQAEASYKAMVHRAERLRRSYELMAQGPRKERIEVARADALQAKANLTKARWRLDNCTIRAPVSGTILRKIAEEGNIVNPIAFNISSSICEMADLSDLEVELSIQERDVARVFKGQRCLVVPDAYPDRRYQGVVSRLMPIADRAKGAIPVRVKLSLPQAEEGVYLRPEMGAVVSFYHPDTQAR